VSATAVLGRIRSADLQALAASIAEEAHGHEARQQSHAKDFGAGDVVRPGPTLRSDCFPNSIFVRQKSLSVMAVRLDGTCTATLSIFGTSPGDSAVPQPKKHSVLNDDNLIGTPEVISAQ
jgi:hypothetical protein